MDSAFPFSFFANMTDHFDLSLEEFQAFHSIDRKLYYNLVVNLRRDPTRSLHVVALFLWLERECRNYNIVFTILTLPISYIETLADEADAILTCFENDGVCLLRGRLEDNNLPHLQNLLGYRFTLAYFHQHRGVIVAGVRRIAADVCMAALHDIMQAVVEVTSNNSALMTTSVMPPPSFSDTYYYGRTLVKKGGFLDLLLKDQTKQELDDEINELIRQLPKEEPFDEDDPLQVPADERTVFLTFSKGYPITENEVREYFIRKYGDVVESVFMQEVPHHTEQSLYALLVLRSPLAMDSILNSKGKEKFSINGKHVWARKYVRK
ncbi:hypothetical protein MLD38_038109 [Melastoma candidum]|uniref:Uncharacterized protein n=1 Tax=Melastoma candidum TaxID=119954 RepID=A0ACB9KZ19_9MYRT|nr:hypothetical protein MLD38_038109 [Melastoma candidum]